MGCYLMSGMQNLLHGVRIGFSGPAWSEEGRFDLVFAEQREDSVEADPRSEFAFGEFHGFVWASALFRTLCIKVEGEKYVADLRLARHYDRLT